MIDWSLQPYWNMLRVYHYKLYVEGLNRGEALNFLRSITPQLPPRLLPKMAHFINREEISNAGQP